MLKDTKKAHITQSHWIHFLYKNIRITRIFSLFFEVSQLLRCEYDHVECMTTAAADGGWHHQAAPAAPAAVCCEDEPGQQLHAPTSLRLLLLLKVFVWEELELLTHSMHQVRLEGLQEEESELSLIQTR